MIVDEADELLRGNLSFFDLLFGGGAGGKSTEKGVVNTILDEMKMPAIWISNAPAQAMDESVRRRFDYSICFEELNNAQRISIWRNVVRKLNLGKLISEAQIADYAGNGECDTHNVESGKTACGVRSGSSSGRGNCKCSNY